MDKKMGPKKDNTKENKEKDGYSQHSQRTN